MFLFALPPAQRGLKRDLNLVLDSCLVGCVQLENFRCSFYREKRKFSAWVSTPVPDLLCRSPACVFCLLPVLGEPQQALLPAWEDQSGWSAPQQESPDGRRPESHRHLQEDRARGRSGPPVPPPPEPGLWEKRRHFYDGSSSWEPFFKSVLPVQLRSTGAIWSGWRAVSVLTTLRIRTLKGRASRCPSRTPR